MSNPAPFKPVNGMSFGFAERFDPEYEMTLTRSEDGEVKPYSLFEVIIIRRIPQRRPVVSTYLVLAPDEDGAIAQVQHNAFPEDTGCVLSPEQLAMLKCSARRVPFHIRGWGNQTF